MKLILTIIFTLTFVCSGFAQQTPEYKTYKDTEYPFLLTYPISWAQATPTEPDTRILIGSENGAGGADLNVNVSFNKKLESFTPQQFVEFIKAHSEVPRNALIGVYPSAIIESSGATYLSSRPAYFIKSNFTIRSLDEEMKITALQIQMLFEGNLYTITCRAPQARFDEYYPVFKRIIATFNVVTKKYSGLFKPKAVGRRKN